MIALTRELRFSLIAGENDRDSQEITNSWGGWPSAEQLAPFLTLECELFGEVDSTTGYLCNIKEVDEKIRKNFVLAAAAKWQAMTPESLAACAFETITNSFTGLFVVSAVTIKATPTLAYTIRSEDAPMLRVTQQFEFSASHRLHNPDLSDEQNRELFGKCNNPHGHGHNYVIEVTIASDRSQSNEMIGLTSFERVVKRLVIDPLDHKYLNIEVDEFHDLNPSVENIAIVIWERLKDHLKPSKLDRVRVYETPKTWADYSGR